MITMAFDTVENPICHLEGNPLNASVTMKMTRIVETVAAVATCERARVDLVSLDADGARWRVSGVPKHGKGAASLADAVSQAIADQGIALGRGHSGRGTRP